MADDAAQTTSKVSALTAFAQAKKEAAVEEFAQDASNGEVVEVINTLSDAASQPVQSLKDVASTERMSLADFAQQQQGTAPRNKASPSTASTYESTLHRPDLMDITKASEGDARELRQAVGQVSLIDVANSAPKPSLMEVATSKPRTSLLESVKRQQAADSASLIDMAKANKAKKPTTVAKVLGAIAQDESRTVGNQLEHKMKEALDDVRHEQNQQARDALRSAVHEVQYDSEFDYESSADKINRAVDILVGKQQPVEPPSVRPTISVDRDILRSRQRRGLQHTCPTVKSRQSKLSSFQLNQLTETQKRLLYATLVEHKPPSSKRDNQAQMEYINRIAKPVKPKKRLGKEQYARESDRRHCKFKPRVGRGSAESGGRSDDDDDDNGNDNQDFIRRMEAAEKAKLDSIERQRAERVYLAQLDKKECPKCGNPQSYAEVQQKRKQCPNCGVTYRSRLAWGDISHEFFERVELSEEQRVRNLEQLTMEWMPRFRVTDKRVFDRRRNCMVTVKAKPITWDQVEQDFLTRVRLDASNRITNREELEQKFYGAITFHPHITAHAKRMQYERFEMRMQKDIDQRMLRQEQNKIMAEARALYGSSATSTKL
ncbi:hypothetical protein, variant 1 [Aphanomyces invadans]|uniref:Uncharacterized protein n=1 Tax=Aphanomyces invadans TaxID=157072 RepID=A0A024URD0_9STRA|nr:hypothetical protein, variant 1 [Aphanomyces invadans]ETW08183.1 hypothetical protein, variant 1 [Aphanomyces invadans]|eukprot:XP_008861988.1 hypothetical protein, variant 1 [Aphanomyces invadans]